MTLFLSGCSSSPDQPELTPLVAARSINTKVLVSGQVNPDDEGRASPIVIRLFELKNLGTYNQSDFYGLFENYKSVLGSDLLASEQIHLKPGEIRTIKHDTVPGTQYIAVVAAFRNIDQAVWKNSIAISAGNSAQIMLFVDKLAISLWKK